MPPTSLRVIPLAANLIGFYAGRTPPGEHETTRPTTWVEDGALSLGICSAITWFAPYQAVHQANLAAVRG